MSKNIRIPGYYTSDQICAMYQIDRTTLWRWKKEGLPAHENKARQLFKKKEINDFLKESDKNTARIK